MPTTIHGDVERKVDRRAGETVRVWYLDRFTDRL